MPRTKILLWFLFSVIISFIIYFTIYDSVYPLGGMNLKYDDAEIKQLSRQLLDKAGVETADLKVDADLNSSRDLLRQVQIEKGLNEGNKLIRDSIPVYYWSVSWFRTDRTNITITGSGARENRAAAGNDEIKLRYSTDGKLLQFTRYDIDSLQLTKITHDEAAVAAEIFLLQFTDFKLPFDSADRDGIYNLKSAERRETDNRTEYEFTWTGKSQALNNDVTIKLTVSGNLISHFEIDEQISSEKYSSDTERIFTAVAWILFFIVIFILIGIIAYRRIKAFEIGFRTAVIMGLITALFFALEIYFTISEQTGWEIIIPLIVGPILYGGAIIVLWAASETVTREAWPDKFISTDLLTKGYSLHSKIGAAFLTGSSSGFLISAVWLLGVFIAAKIIPMSYTMEDNEFFPNLNSPAPALTLLTHNVYAVTFITTVYFLFLVSALKRRIASIAALVAVTAVIWGLVHLDNFTPFYSGLIVEIITGALLVLLFIKTDLLTVFIGLISFNVLRTGYAFFSSGNITYIESGYFLAAVFIILVIYSLITLFTRDKITDYQNITPAFEKNITERQRLQRELEIARDVQMSFLPQRIPTFRGLDIASRCVPALEVGGDYYDFVPLSDTRMGIIIGDVSGKGTQAAFYMTLTKGFLKAISKLSDSASEMLSKMNELFYENVERGTFISMIYGIFDTEKNILRIARAGHNPVIARKTISGNIQMLNPTGLALGLEKGTIFNRTIKEMEVHFEPGDVFVFYTDGFTEAMNKSRDEYGETRLSEAVEKYSDKPAAELMDIILTDVKAFMGKAKQHDDMTMVVVKIT